ncbi:hypothetical protein FALBO_11498 [Fusarium albosuccineum]|uniref:Uncharacterized protein n=1 Tax=Fusarium albosuccineum TaxID=1237068 RepID=A0A8H4L453_9HYPO|nr:hypothetical protein FALBO_11498 [Fusarium albosuccineum]
MSSAQPRAFFFLEDPSSKPGSSGRKQELSAEARSHISRQAHLRASRGPKGLKFVTYFPRTIQNRDGAIEAKESGGDRSEATADGKSALVDANSAYIYADASESIPPIPDKGASLDPFNSLAVTKTTSEDRFLLHYVFSRTLPAFGETASDKRDFTESWISRTMECPAVFYSQILGASTHFRITCPAAGAKTHIHETALQRKIQAIKALRTTVEQSQLGSRGIDNSVLLTIFILAIHDNFDASKKPEPHPLSPLARCRDMDIYGRMSFGKQHINALYYLVEQKGGISSIDQHVFGYVLPLFDIVLSARFGTVPRFSCPRQLKPLLDDGAWKPDEEAIQMLKTLGEELQPSPNMTWPPFLTPEMVEVVQAMAEITVALDHHSRSGPGAPTSVDVLFNNCDWATHTLLSIPPYIELPDENRPQERVPNIVSCLREICRLCALVYVDMVILPTPPHTGIKRRLSEGILRLIETVLYGNGERHSRVSEFLVWATMLGAIAARFTDLEGSYRKHIKKIVQISAWDVIHRQLKRYLWFGPVCDDPAVKIWSDTEAAILQSPADVELLP